MNESRISLRQVQVALHVAIGWQIVLLALESQRDWRIVEYAAWILPCMLLFSTIELVFHGIDRAFHGNRHDLQGLRVRSCVVAYLAAVVTFSRETIIASVVYALLRVLAGPLHRRRLAWMPVDIAMIIASLVWLALGELDAFEFASILTVMVAIITVSIYQDDTTTERST